MTAPLYMGMLGPGLLSGGFRKHVFLPLEPLGLSYCQHNNNPDNEMSEAWACRPVGYSQCELLTQGPNFQSRELCLDIPG